MPPLGSRVFCKMADDSSKTSGQEIDLDNIEVEILIICKNVHALNQAGSFLTRRGWPTTVISDISKAVEFIAEKKPDYVLISLSHPSPSISKLPDLITQTFNTPCVGFVETNDASSSAKLNQVKVRFKMQGQASGPSIHRTLRKILAERFHIETEDKGSDNASAEKSAEGGSFTRVKGAGPGGSDGPGVIIQKSSASLMKNKGPQMIRGAAASDNEGAEGGMQSVSQGGSKSQNGQRRKLSGMGDEDEMDGGEISGVDGLGSEGEESSGSLGSNPSEGGRRRGRNPKTLKDIDEADGGSPNSNLESDEGSESELLGEGGASSRAKGKSLKDLRAEGAPNESIDQEGAESANSENEYDESGEAIAEARKSRQPRKSLKALEGVSDNSGSTGDMLFGKALEGKSGAAATMPTKDLVGMLKKSLFGENGEEVTAAIDAAPGSTQPKGPQSVLERAVEAAVGRVCQSIEEIRPVPLEEIGFVGVFPVESSTQPGYLVVVWQAPDQSSREAFFRSCETEINSAFASMNVPGKLESGFWVQLPPVDFVQWAGAKATFTFMSAHQKREVGVAFFETKGPLPKATPADDKENMHYIPMDSVSTELPVTFKAFIHFKNNGRYFLYLRNGRMLQPEQKARLLEKQFDRIYMKHVDLENLRHYLATAYLSGLIIEFKRAA